MHLMIRILPKKERLHINANGLNKDPNMKVINHTKSNLQKRKLISIYKKGKIEYLIPNLKRKIYSKYGTYYSA